MLYNNEEKNNIIHHMKLLLTSAGVTNRSIAKSLHNLANKPKTEIKIGFIPTAANVEEGNKDWFIKQLTDLNKNGFAFVDIIDITAATVDWKERLALVDVIYLGGGNTFHLLNQVRLSGFESWLKDTIEEKVYIGASAGSIIATPSIAIAGVEPGDSNIPQLTDLTGLNFVTFEISPHTPEMVSNASNAKYAKNIANALYEIDDNTAIEVINNRITIVSEGVWKKIK